MSAAEVKPDPSNVKLESYVKNEPDISPLDDDDYEDTGELHIPEDGTEATAWLARLPRWLWEAWNDIAEDEEIVLGKIRYYKDLQGNGTNKIRMILNDVPGHAHVPKKYDIEINKSQYNNTVVFSEKDQHKDIGDGWHRSRMPYDKASRNDKIAAQKASKKPFRSSIAKQTALEASLQNEITVLAEENDEYRHMTTRWLEKTLKTDDRAMVFQPTLSDTHIGQVTNNAYTSFTSSAKAKQKGQEKAVRIPESELLDLLIACYREFKYWSLKALLQRLHQPEAYIKAQLDKIATLIKSGVFSNQYVLKPEFREMGVAAKDEAAKESDGDTKDEMGGDEDTKMENA